MKSKGEASSLRRPRYRKVAEALLADIQSGRLAVGATLPGEIELTEKFGVSRHTVREALRRLEQLGLIGRRPGVGTAVLARQPQNTYIQSVRTPAALLQYPPGACLQVQTQQPLRASRQLARLIGCKAGADWIRISCLRVFEDARPPLNWVDLFVQPRFAAIVADLGGGGVPVYQLIERRYGIKVQRVDVSVMARNLPAHMSDALQVAAGSPSLTVVRRYHDEAGELFQASVSEHPGERFTYSLSLERGWLADGGATWTSG